MAETMQFDLVSPERKLASVSVVSVQIPGMEGDLTAMPRHAPLLTTLRPGVVRVNVEDGGSSEYVVTGGFAEITPSGTTVLAEEAMPRGEASADFLERLERAADAALSEAPVDRRLAAGQRVRDVGQLRRHLSL